MSGNERKLVGLQVFTGLVVAFVRHDLEKNAVVWESFEQFLLSWFIHTIAVLILIALAVASMLRFHTFFLGYELGGSKDKVEELAFYISMTVLVASVCIFFVAHGPTSDD